MAHQLPNSSTSTRIGAGAEEPWQLVVRNGAGLLAIGLSMPVVIGQLWTWCFTLLGLETTQWSAMLLVIRALHLVANVIAGVGLYRLVKAPMISRDQATRALWLFGASVVTSSLLGGMLWMIGGVIGLLAWLAIIEIARTIDGTQRDDGRPAGLWRVLSGVTIAATVAMWAISLGGLGTTVLGMGFGVVRFVEVVLLIVGFVGLRRLLR